MSGQGIEYGTCSACGEPAMRFSGGTSGAWRHGGTLCDRPDPAFLPRQQGAPPRDRQINEPRRDR